MLIIYCNIPIVRHARKHSCAAASNTATERELNPEDVAAKPGRINDPVPLK
jgi:hypothetical protein